MVKKTDTESAIEGLRKLAFGRCNDAVKLVFAEDPPSAATLGRMDLFNVASIARDKGGGVEVRFFDRQRALERLYEYAHASQEGASARSLLDALTGADDDGV